MPIYSRRSRAGPERSKRRCANGPGRPNCGASSRSSRRKSLGPTETSIARLALAILQARARRHLRHPNSVRSSTNLATRLGIVKKLVLPDVLARAAQALFDARYADVRATMTIETANSIEMPLRVHALVIRAAALFALYRILRSERQRAAGAGPGKCRHGSSSGHQFSPKYSGVLPTFHHVLSCSARERPVTCRSGPFHPSCFGVEP